MRRRLSLMLVAVPLLLVLTLPAAAPAGSRFWVRDRRGDPRRLGEGQRRLRHHRLARGAPRSRPPAAVPAVGPSGRKRAADRRRGSRPHQAVRQRARPSAPSPGAAATGSCGGAAARGDQVRGTVAGGCPARLAAGAVRLLCWTTTAPTYTLTTEPEAGYEPVYRFIASARKTLDMTMYSLVDPAATAALDRRRAGEGWRCGCCSTRRPATRRRTSPPTTTSRRTASG